MDTRVSLLDRPVKKHPGGRPKTSDRDDIVVKLDRAVAAQARYVAETRGIPLAEYLTLALRPVVAKDFQKVAMEGTTK